MFLLFIGRAQWSNACQHVESLIEKAVKNDHFVEIIMNKLIINLADDRDSYEFSVSDSDGDIFIVVCWCFKHCSAMVLLFMRTVLVLCALF